jgi:hypothetical protein
MNDNQHSIIDLLENEEMWSQRAIDKPDDVMDELRYLKEQKIDPDVSH